MSFQKISLRTCPKGCCNLKTRSYIPTHKCYAYRDRKKELKGGMFFYDPTHDKVLLVQSRGEKWGPPKGKKEDCETIEECAIREVTEETGVVVPMERVLRSVKYTVDKATYYYMEQDFTQSTVSVDSSSYDNDATGVSWISPMCLLDMINTRCLDVNSHCKKLLYKILKIKI